MELFVIDLDDPPERWETLYRRVEHALAAVEAHPPPRGRADGARDDDLELLQVFWGVVA